MNGTDTIRAEIRLLGDPSAIIDGAIANVHNRRAFVVVAAVALDGGSHSRQRLAATCWEDAPPPTANANLRSVLSNLRRVAPGLLDIRRDAVELGADARSSIDVLRFLDAVDATVGDPSVAPRDRIAACNRAIEEYNGELLTGFDELVGSDRMQWIEAERRSLAMRHVDALATLVDLLRSDDRASDAAEVALRLVAADPYREQSHVALIEALFEAGERHEALRQVERCRDVLVDDLGVTLSPSTLALAERVRRGHVERTRTSRSPGMVVSDLLPLPERRILFGREKTIKQLVSTDRSDGSPIVTLVGAGGVGKTSLVIELAHRWRSAGHGVVFVDVTEIEQPDDVVEAIGRSLGSPVIANLDDLSTVIGDRDLRLIIDNFEQLVATGVDVLGGLIRACPEVTLVVTSRIPLNTSDESIVIVDGLELPEEQAQPEELAGQSAVRLFRHTARRRGATLGGDGQGLERIARLCRLLEGLPIAIELAASQVRSVGLDNLIERIEANDISVLESDLTDRPDRHRNFLRIVQGSLDLVGSTARRRFALAAVFEGPFTVEAMAHVDSEPTTTGNQLRSLQELVDLHLLRREDADGMTWFSLQPALRSVAQREMDETGAANEAASRRVDYDCELLVRAANDSQSAQARTWLAFLDRYGATLRDTLDRLHHGRDQREPVALAGLGQYWLDRGLFAEGARRLGRCTLPSDSVGGPWLGAALRMWEVVLRAEAIGYQAVVELVDTVSTCLDTIRSTASVENRLAMMQLACHAFDLADRPDLAEPLLDEGVDLAGRFGAPWFSIQFRYSQAMIAHVDGDDGRADRLLRSVVADAQLHGHRRIEMYAHMLMALAGGEGPPGSTPWTLRDLLDRAVELGDRRQVIWILVSLGAVSILDDDLPTMARWDLEALTLSQNGGYFLGVRYCVMAAATGAAMTGDLATAQEFHGAVESDLDSIGRSMPRAYFEPYLELAAALDAALTTDAALARARQRGAAAPQREIQSRVRDWLLAMAASAPSTST